MLEEKSYHQMSASEKQKEDWMNSKWRPMMGWMYMAVCVCDFIVFPILWSIVQAVDNDGAVRAQWQPLTLQGAGLFHIAMGAVLGIAAYGRTQEKLSGASNDNFPQSFNNDTPAPSNFNSGFSKTAVPATNRINKPAPQEDEPL